MPKNKTHKKIDKSSFKPKKQQTSIDDNLFKFSFKKYDYEISHWNALTSISFIEKVIHKLEDFSCQNWHDIKSISGGKAKGNGTNNHFIDGVDLAKEYKERFIKLGYMKKYDKVFSLRLQSKQRLIGVVDNGIFYILWLDLNHEIVPIKK